MKKKIAIIEDNLELRENIEEILELNGYDVRAADNGRTGVDLVNDFLPDLVVCDIMMPILDGFGVLHLLSKQPETASIPFIFLTAKAERHDMRKGMEMGADDFITKPFDDIELISAIESRLRKIDLIAKPFSNRLNAFEELLFRRGSLKAVESFASSYEKREFKKKSIVYLEGDWPRYLYYVKSGKIKTFKTNDDGKELILNIYGEDSFFGFTALIKDEQMADSAQVIEDAELIMIPKSEFYSIIYGNKEVLKKLIEILSTDLEKQEGQLLKMAYNSVRKRVADALIELIDSYSGDLKGKGYKIARENIANYAGTSLETCIRTLSEFKENKLIEIEGGRIRLLDREALVRLKI
ncbi:response regulator [Marinilongibacter aquaticus]|uniref:response regulator n=1 Tax=Marinilongibacter aquaticus TaxID=2975157 RepID=UPI0021BDB76D|nr:response regulator [Marinilongibacter aquaticus]UBM58547.1 response regulator [Marinilongibacter aquaticus]